MQNININISLITMACVRMPKKGSPSGNEDEKGGGINTSYLYVYPYNNEVTSPYAEIVIKLNNPITAQELKATIPHLKYNKSSLQSRLK